jgi:hypothetical protein
MYTTLSKKSSNEEKKERLTELGPMVLEIINAHVHSFSVVATREEALVLDAQGIAVLKELKALVVLSPERAMARARRRRPRRRSWTRSRPPSEGHRTRLREVHRPRGMDQAATGSDHPKHSGRSGISL